MSVYSPLVAAFQWTIKSHMKWNRTQVDVEVEAAVVKRDVKRQVLRFTQDFRKSIETEICFQFKHILKADFSPVAAANYLMIPCLPFR